MLNIVFMDFLNWFLKLKGVLMGENYLRIVQYTH